MEIIEYTKKWKDKWDNFVLESNNGTIFHMQKFFDYHPEGKFTFNHLIFLDKGNIVALLPGSMIGSLYESPIGSSYGSIVLSSICEKKTRYWCLPYKATATLIGLVTHSGY